jgi:voltage-gated potassium channel
MSPSVAGTPRTLRRRLYEVIEVGRGETPASKAFDYFIIFLIVASVAAFCIQTVPSVDAVWGRWIEGFETFCVTVFTIEYLCRLWTAVEVPMLSRLSPWRARWRYARRPVLIIDLLAILPAYLAPLIGLDLTVMRILRLLRFLKLTRYSPAIHTLLRVLVSEQRPLAGALVLLVAALLFFSTGMYYIEGRVQPEKFGSVPDAAYWAITTLTTVGYGDVTPITPLGKIRAALAMVAGLCVLALPVAIIATGFATEVGRHDFVLTWSLMSRIPLFAELDTDEVARLMPLLHAKSVPPFTEVLSDGAPGDAMYFIASGQVRHTSPTLARDYQLGEFFGVVAMLEDGQSVGSYRSVTRSRLLKLHREDFLELEAATPALAEHLRRVAATRKEHRQAAEDAAVEAAIGSIAARSDPAGAA